MSVLTPLNSPLQPHRLQGLQRLLPLAAAGLFFLAVVLGAFHFHEDLTTHPDCAICAVAHHAPAVTVPPPTLVDITLPELPAQFASPYLTVGITHPPTSLRSRAPPR